MSKTTVVVIGGSSGGLAVFEALDKAFSKPGANVELVLVERRAAYQHTLGNVRSIVDAEYAKQSWVEFKAPRFSNANRRRVQGEVTKILPNQILLADGTAIAYTYLVIATGTKIPAPFRPLAWTPAEGIKEQGQYIEAIKKATSILLVGGGPVAVEAAGEIIAVFPDKKVTLVSSNAGLVHAGPVVPPAMFPQKLSDSLAAQLKSKGVEVVLGERVDLSSFGGQTFVARTQTLTTDKGREITSDLQMVAVGEYQPNSEAVASLGAGVLDSKGFVKVGATLQVQGFPDVFAVGDVAATGATKLSYLAAAQAAIAAKNIVKLITKSTKPLDQYAPPTSNMTLVTLGKWGGAVYMGTVLGPWMAKMMKGGDLFLGRAGALASK